jgi:hypothetical protein
MKIVATMLATAALGMVSLGAAACKDDGADAASGAPSTSPVASAGASSAPPVSASPAAPPAGVSPQATPSKKPKPSNNQVVMIGPDGKKYTRKWMIRNAMMMSGMTGNSNFCGKSYAESVKRGAKFPAGKAAFMDACKEGIDLAN